MLNEARTLVPLLSLCLLGATFIKYKYGESFPTGRRTHSDVYLAKKDQLAKEKHCFVDLILLPLENQMDVVCSLNNGFNQLSPPKAWNETASHLTICLDCVEWNVILFKRKLRSRRHRCLCLYYANSDATFHLELIGDLVLS